MKRLQALCIYAGPYIPFFAMWYVNLYWKNSIDFLFRYSIFDLQMLRASGLLFSLGNTL